MPKKSDKTNQKKIVTDNHDRNFKELIGTFTLEFLQIFTPEVLKFLQPNSLVPLDKEIFTDIAVGEQHEVDLIFRATFKPSASNRKRKGEGDTLAKTESETSESIEPLLTKNAKEVYFVIHIEAQSTHRSDFPRRMFIYFSRLTEKYNQPVYPIVIFSFDNLKSTAASSYVMKFPNKTVLQFDYDAIQLNQLDWHNYVNNPNPVASALMAKMKIASEDRPTVKLECLKMLVGLELDPAKSHLITSFINTYLKLDQQQKQVFEAKLAELEPNEEKERVMQVVNEWTEEGIIRGRHEGQVNTLLLLLSSKLGQPLSAEFVNKINGLSEEVLTSLTLATISFNSLQDLSGWLNTNSSKVG